MKLKLPLGLLAALFACANMATAHSSETYEYTDETIPVYKGDELIGSSTEDYTVYVHGSSGYGLDVNAQYVTWNSSYEFDKKPLSVGSILTDSTVSIVTPEGAEEETVVATKANLFIGGWGWGISSTDGINPNSGTVKVKDATLIVGKNSGGDSSCSQLNVGQAGSYADYQCEGRLEADHATVLAGVINVALSSGTKGTLVVDNGSTVTAERRGDASNSKNYTGSIYLGYFANTTADVIVDGKSTLTADKDTYVGMAYDSQAGGASATLTVQGESTADLGSMLVVGYYTDAKGIVTVDNSTLTAGTTYLGCYGATGTMTLQNNATATMGETFFGRYSEGTGTMTLQDNSTATMGDTWLGFNSGSTGTMTLQDNSSVTMGDTCIGYKTGSSGEMTVSSGSAATTGQLVIGYFTGSKGKVTVDAATLTAGDTFVGDSDADGQLVVSNGGKVTADYMYVGGSLSIDEASSVKVEGGVENTGTISATLTNGGSFEAASLTNNGTLNVELANGGSFTVGEYIHNGTATIYLGTGTECRVGSLEMYSSGLTVTGKGKFVLGYSTPSGGGDSGGDSGGGDSSGGDSGGGVATTSSTLFTIGTSTPEGSTTAEATATVIDITALNDQIFEFDTAADFTLNFTEDMLSTVASGTTKSLEILLIRGYDGFTIGEEALADMLDSTNYTFAGQSAATPMLLALDAETPGFNAANYSLTGDAAYVMKGSDLYWTGSVAAVPEPTTATLSLLALAALAARRRRK